MSRVCQITNKRPRSGHTVSHSNRKVKRRFLPNIKFHRFKSKDRGTVRLKVCSKGLKIIDKLGIEEVLNQLELKGHKFTKTILESASISN